MIDDLDLEFENEEEQKGDDALNVGIDLSFSAAGESSQKAAPPKKQSSSAAPSMKKEGESSPQGKVADLEQARKNAESKNQAAPNSSQPSSQPQAKVVEQTKPAPSPQFAKQELSRPEFASELHSELECLKTEISELKEQMRSAQEIVDVKVAIAEAKAEFMTEYMSNAKLMDHQVNQILQRIHKKSPQLKTEVLTIKKFITEFIKNSSPKK